MQTFLQIILKFGNFSVKNKAKILGTRKDLIASADKNCLDFLLRLFSKKSRQQVKEKCSDSFECHFWACFEGFE